jgi:putative tryptophan/tyrosine transport system substrate-binding protein
MSTRRQFISLLGGAAAAWPLAARGQQSAPVVGFLSSIAAGERPHHTEAFRQGLNDTGYAEGRNLTIEYRFADNRLDQLEPLALKLIARRVAVIAAVGGNNSALTVKRLTSAIPILFTSGLDPVTAGLVASINRPGGNVTGVSWFATELGSKHLEVLNELVPQAALIALLLNPTNPEGAFYERSAQEGARTLGRRLLVLKAASPAEIDAAFATVAEQRANAVIVSSDPFYTTRGRQLAVLAARHVVPMISSVREIAVAGGLLSYGNSVTDAYRRVGVIAGRILKGAKPAETPVDRATRFELVINIGTAKALSAANAAGPRRRGDRMRRREFITLFGGAAAGWPLGAQAQQAKVAQIGVLFIGLADTESFKKEVREGLRELGYVEGQNIAFEFRSAEGQLDRLPRLAAELVQLKVDVIVTLYVPPSLAAKDRVQSAISMA